MLKIEISSDATHFIKTREPKHRRQILNKIVSLQQDPNPPDSRHLASGDKGQRRATAGEYRIIYWVIPSSHPGMPGILRVGAVGKRNDDEVYRRFDKH